MKTFKEIWEDIHDDLPELAHDIYAYLVYKYGKNSEEAKQLRKEQKPS